ncbi:hypothetical protein JYU34_012432 [Plutella xylostella]|uniref:Lipase domain-containing protein n=1 Tax=Plutella xylostella TaxID=51655 RepID=A0ABQ7QBC5_PLUXY|nr:hypothetical protein JYU34_012432 [Plutella xylostella]
MLLYILLLAAKIHGVVNSDQFAFGLICGCDRSSIYNVSEVKVYAYNYASNISEVYTIDDAAAAILNRQDFDPGQCIDIFISGYTNTIDSEPSQVARCTLSKITCKNKGTLAILFDHSAYTNQGYIRAIDYAKSIGQAIGRMVLQLLSKVSIRDINISGHSLGAQIMGYTAETVKNAGSPFPIIYAMDPAGPCYQECPKEHVRSGQADTVVSFHCSTREGTELRISDYNFISDGGSVQKGCTMSSCSHFKCAPISFQPSIEPDIWKSRLCDGKQCSCETVLAGYRVPPPSSAVPGSYCFSPSLALVCDVPSQ